MENHDVLRSTLYTSSHRALQSIGSHCALQNGRLALAVLLSHCSQFGASFRHLHTEGVARLLVSQGGAVTGVLTKSGARCQIS